MVDILYDFRFELKVDPDNEPILLPDIIMRSENGVHVKLVERNG